MHTCIYCKILSVIVCLLCIIFSVGIDIQSKFVFEENKRVTAITNVEALAPSAVDCARICKSSLNCTAANYLAETKTCQIFKTGCFVTEYAIGWSYLSPDRPIANRTFQYIPSQTLTWYDAKNYCESIGGGLVNVMSTDDHERITSIVSQFGNTPVWLGGSDEVTEGEWIWSNGCRVNDQDAIFWSIGEPNNAGNNENCLIHTAASNWNDGPCSILRNFVCEINVA